MTSETLFEAQWRYNRIKDLKRHLNDLYLLPSRNKELIEIIGYVPEFMKESLEDEKNLGKLILETEKEIERLKKEFAKL